MIKFNPTIIKKFPNSQRKNNKESRFWKNFKEVYKSFYKGIISQISFSPSKPYELFFANLLQVKSINLVESFPLRKFEALKDVINCLDINSEGKLAIMGGSDQLIHLVGAQKRMKIKCFFGHESSIRDVCFGPQKTILSVADEGNWKLWDIQSGQEILFSKNVQKHTI